MREGLTNPGETEYFIRTLEDRPPEVRLLKPARDRSVTRLDEVDIEAQAEDDFGIDRLELVYAVRGGAERVAPLAIPRQSASVTGTHTLYLEDLDVQPGDFVVVLRARARRRARQARERDSQRHFFPRGEGVRARVQARAKRGGDGGDPQQVPGRPRHGAEGSHRRHLEARSARADRQRRQVRAGHPIGVARRGGTEDARGRDVQLLPRIDDARSPAWARRRSAAAPGCRNPAPARHAQGRPDHVRGRRDDGRRLGDGPGGAVAERAQDRAGAGPGDGSAEPAAEGASRREEARGVAAAGARRSGQQPHDAGHVAHVRQGAAKPAADELRDAEGRPAARAARQHARQDQGSRAAPGRAAQGAAGARARPRPDDRGRAEARARKADA